MAQAISSVKDTLNRGQLERISRCGSTMPPMVRSDGEVLKDAHFRCTSRWCSSCAKFYQQRVYACVSSAFCQCEKPPKECECPRPYLVTITLKLAPGMSKDQLESNYATISRIQGKVHQALRDHDYACERLEHWRRRGRTDKVLHWTDERRARLPHPADTVRGKVRESSLERFCRSWNDELGFPRPHFGKTTYIWAKEVTTGANNDRWHVHLHYLAPTRGDAERINAAWQLEREQARLARTDISGGPGARYQNAQGELGDDSSSSNPAGYVTKYVSKGSLEGIPAEHRAAYTAGSKNVQRYNAAGQWRPLGISDKRDPDTPPVEWVMWNGELTPFSEFVAGRSATWKAWGISADGDGGRLEQAAAVVANYLASSDVQERETVAKRADSALEGAIEVARVAGYEVRDDRRESFLAQYRSSLSFPDPPPAALPNLHWSPSKGTFCEPRPPD